MKKILLIMTLVFHQIFCAIPQHTITNIDQNVITLASGAQFTIADEESAIVLNTWHTGDSVLLLEDLEAFQIQGIVVINHIFVLRPNFVLRNTTRRDSEVCVYLSTSPTSETTGTRTITAIDMTALTITLSDVTIWRFSASSAPVVRTWQTGQYAMIGQASPFTPGYTSFLFNPGRQEFVVTAQVGVT